MSKLTIRLPAVIEVTLTDSEYRDLVDVIRDEREAEDDQHVDNDHVRDYIKDLINDDLASFAADFGPAIHIDEDKITVTEK